MADRHTLHFNKLESFKNWLIKNNWEIKPLSKSQHEVLRATKDGRWVIIYLKDSATEHYSLTDNSISVVNQWLRERKIRETVCKEIREFAYDTFKEFGCFDETDLERILDKIQGE